MSVSIGNEVRLLTQRAREVLSSGRCIALLGLNGYRDDREIRNLSGKGKKIRLYDSIPATGIGPRVGLALHTEYVDHRDTDPIDKSVLYKHSVGVGVMKEVLRSCVDLLIPPRTPVIHRKMNGHAVETIVQAPPMIKDHSDETLDFLTTPSKEHEMDNRDRFIQAFLKEAQESKEGLVGKIRLGKLLKQYEVKEGPEKLIHDAWLVGVVRNGCIKVGWYKVGEKMLKIITQEKFEPEDPTERARFLIAQKANLLAERGGLETALQSGLDLIRTEFEDKISQVNKKLKRIETAEKLLGELEAL